MLWGWLQTKRDENRHEVDEDEVSIKDGAGCLVDGCCLGGCLLDLFAVAVIAGGVVALGLSAIRVVVS